MTLKVELQARILDHPEIEMRKSRFSGVEAFYVQTREIAHFHSNQEIDIRLTCGEIKKRKLAHSEDKRIHVPRASGDWVEVTFKSLRDLPFVQELVVSAARENLKEIKLKRSQR